MGVDGRMGRTRMAKVRMHGFNVWFVQPKTAVVVLLSYETAFKHEMYSFAFICQS
jgi:hypothetical protein